MSATFRVDSVKDFVEDLTGLTYFSEDGLGECVYEPGESKLIVITGENATGKSFVRKLMKAALGKHKIECMDLSMQKRSAAGDISRCLIYGDEGYQATGSLSSNAVLGAIHNSRDGWSGKRHAIVWDEPDVGLSDNYAAGAGVEIREFMQAPPENLFFAVVTTHRRVLLKELLALKPHHLRLGDRLTLAEVMKAKVKPRKLQELRERNSDMCKRLAGNFKL